MSLSDLQKKLEQEARGIMFPFNASASTVNTTQNVYNSATDGIMNMQGKKYVGPDSVIQYTPEGQRQLKEIEKGMLPQFDQEQFPDIGQGKVEDRGGTPPLGVATPSTYQTETPAVDPCPPGFKYDPQLQRCVPIEQPKSSGSDKVEPDNRKNIGDIAKGLEVATDALNKAEFQKNVNNYNKDVDIKVDNSTPWLDFIPLIGKPLNFYLKNQADKQLQTLGNTEGISVIKNDDGTFQLKITNDVGKRNFARLQTQQSLAGNLKSTQKKDSAGNIMKAPNGQNMIQGPILLNYFGKDNIFAPENEITMPRDAAGNIIRNEATEAAFRKKLQDRTQTVDALNAEEKNKLLSELDAALGLDSTATASKPVTVDPESTAADATARNAAAFGEVTSLDKSLQYFGQLNRDKDVLQMQIDAINKELAGQNVRLPQVKAKYADYLDNKKKFETKLKKVENEITKAEQDAKNTEEKLAKSDRQTAAKIASDYNSRVGERAEKRQKEFEEKQRIKATKSPEQRQEESKQRTENFKNMTQSIRNFNRR